MNTKINKNSIIDKFVLKQPFKFKAMQNNFSAQIHIFGAHLK